MRSHYVFGEEARQVYNKQMEIRLLIVDDAAFIREVLVHIAKKAKIAVVGEAVDGEDALEKALRLKPDIILMDIVMPKKSGIQATKEILAELPQTKIIACSTEGQESMIVKALEAGCCDYIVKPFDVNNVIKILMNTNIVQKNKEGING